MPKFEVPKSFDDTKPPKIAPNGLYDWIVTRAELKPNKAEDGMNLEIDLTLVNDPEYEGIRQTIYQAMPKPGDDEKKTKQGQTLTDFKLDRLNEIIVGLGGTVAGKGFELPDNAMCQWKLERLKGENGDYNRLVEKPIAKKPSRKKLT